MPKSQATGLMAIMLLELSSLYIYVALLLIMWLYSVSESSKTSLGACTNCVYGAGILTTKIRLELKPITDMSVKVSFLLDLRHQ